MQRDAPREVLLTTTLRDTARQSLPHSMQVRLAVPASLMSVLRVPAIRRAEQRARVSARSRSVRRTVDTLRARFAHVLHLAGGRSLAQAMGANLSNVPLPWNWKL